MAGTLSFLRHEYLVFRLKCIGDVFQKDETEHEMLVLPRIPGCCEERRCLRRSPTYFRGNAASAIGEMWSKNSFVTLAVVL